MRFLGGKRAQARSHLVSQPDRRGDRGAAAVEFALVLPLLSLILGGIVSYGAMLGFRPSLSEAAAHGVRAAALEPDPDARQAAGYEAITQSLGGHGITCESGQLLEDATVVGTCAISSEPDCDPAQADPQECVVATVTFDYAAHPGVPTMPGVGFLIPEQLTYAARARVS